MHPILSDISPAAAIAFCVVLYDIYYLESDLKKECARRIVRTGLVQSSYKN